MTATFYTDTPRTITLQNPVDTEIIVFWGDSHDEMTDGSLSHNVRGQKRLILLAYEASIQPTDWRTLVNDILTHFNTNEFLRVGLNNKISRFVPTNNFSYQANYKNQRGRFIPTIELESQELGILSVEFQDYGLITSVVTENLDWGLITESSTQVDYGSV